MAAQLVSNVATSYFSDREGGAKSPVDLPLRLDDAATSPTTPQGQHLLSGPQRHTLLFEAWALFPGAVAYVWHAGTKAGIVQDSLVGCGFETRAQIVWAKNNFARGLTIAADSAPVARSSR